MEKETTGKETFAAPIHDGVWSSNNLPLCLRGIGEKKIGREDIYNLRKRYARIPGYSDYYRNPTTGCLADYGILHAARRAAQRTGNPC